MKKIFYILTAMMLFPVFAKSQTAEAGDIYKIWTYPVVYNYDEKVSWYFDLTGTTFAENEDVYIWIWSPSEPDAGNWGNSSNFAKLTYVGNMVWRFDLTPTLYFGKTPAEIKASAGFWLRLKDKTGSKQSGVSNVPYTDFSGFATSNDPFKFYPTDFYLDKPLSILFNSKSLPGYTAGDSIQLHSGLNDWDVKQEYQAWLPNIVKKVQLKNIGNGIFRIDMIPKDYYNTPEGYVMTKMNFLFVRNNWAATTPDYIMLAPGVPIPPDPILSFFPMKISVKDLFVISRQNNSPGQKLKYTITGGTKTITGSFTGNMDLQKAYINLNGEFGGLSLSKLNVKITDQKSSVIFDSDISLVTRD